MPSSVVHNDDNRWQTIFIEYFLYVYGNRQAVDGHAARRRVAFSCIAAADLIGAMPG